jgi:hypothetical protein
MERDMASTTDFQLPLDQITFPDQSVFTALSLADIESDEEGTYFRLTGLIVEGKRVPATSWKYAAVAEWIDLNAKDPFGIVRSAHDKHVCEIDHEADRADFLNDERRNAA